MSKKGDEKYYIIISLIMGLILIGLIFSWIFQEYLFGEDEINLQQCKESIIARRVIPDDSKIANFINLKEKFPLKCKTQQVTITDNMEKSEVEEKIADAMVACWALFDKGETTLFSRPLARDPSYCFTCARIHFEGGAKDKFTEANSINVDFREPNSILSNKMDNGQTYLSYLTANSKNPAIRTKQFEEGLRILSHEAKTDWQSSISLPAKIDSQKGDVHITFSTWLLDNQEPFNQLLYYQDAETTIQLLSGEKVSGRWYVPFDDTEAACQYWDGYNL